MSAQTHKVGVYFKALYESILRAPLRIITKFFLHFEFPCQTTIKDKGGQKQQPYYVGGTSLSGHYWKKGKLLFLSGRPL